MRQITNDQLTNLLSVSEPPCISLYQPTHRAHPDNQQDPIRYRNLLKEIETSLLQQYSKEEAQQRLGDFQALARDEEFWRHRTDGLAILGSAEKFQIFELQRTVPELQVVADTFHTKPLVRILQSADRYQVLALNRREAKLYEGTRDALDEVELADGVPETIEEALGEELTEPHLTVASYGSRGGRGGAHGVPAMHHGHGQKKDEVEIDEDRYFRAVDRAILEHHSRPSGLPLILAALPQHHALFRQVSRNPFMVSAGIAVDPAALGIDQLRVRAWEQAEPGYLNRLDALTDNYRVALSRQTGSEELAEVAAAAVAGRVGVLLVESERHIAGKLDATKGSIEPGDLDHPEIDDVLDDLAETVLRMQGEVVVLPADRMPSTTGLAAIFRF